MKMIFLHGWGQSAQVWYQQDRHFAGQASLQMLDLPGHGGAEEISAEHWLDVLAERVIQIAGQQDVLLVGWSLGGQLVALLAERLRQDMQLQGLVLVSTTPCFRQRDDWAWGCPDVVWQGFMAAAEHHDARLMQRFFQLMLQGDVVPRREMQALAKQAVNRDCPPSLNTLQAGLRLLDSCDLRPMLADIDVPTLVMHGEQDAIVPVQAGQYLAAHIPEATWLSFEDCGHAPFLTQSATFNRQLEQWWKNISM